MGREAIGVILKPYLDGYLVADPLHGIEYRISNLRRGRDGDLVGDLSVSSGLIGANDVDGLLSEGSFNFSSVPARAARAKLIAQAARTNGKINFLQQLEEVCKHTTAAERTGRPGVILRHVKPAAPHDLHTVEGWKFPTRHLTIVFGAGGTMKSYLALWGVGHLARNGVRVGFVDWELDEHDHSLRDQLIHGADRPDIHYLRAERPLVYELPRIQHWKHDHGLGFLVLDSIGFSTAGKIEDSDAAMAWNRAFRTLDCGGLALAHVRKDGQNPAEAEKYPFGSIYWHNSARCTWFVKVSENALTDGRTKTIGLFNRKMNLSAKLPAVGFAIDFDTDRTTFSRIDVCDVNDLADSLPLWQRVREVVRHGPQTIAQIASELNYANVDSLDRIVRRQKNVFTKITGTDGIHRIALVERRAS
jgi:hypothetical protein